MAAVAGFPGAARLTVRALYRGTGLPWHRVVAAGGRIALTGEDGQEQRLRLRMEGVTFRGAGSGWTFIAGNQPSAGDFEISEHDRPLAFGRERYVGPASQGLAVRE